MGASGFPGGRSSGKRFMWLRVMFWVLLSFSVLVAAAIFASERDVGLALFSLALFGLPVIVARWPILLIYRSSQKRREGSAGSLGSTPSEPSISASVRDNTTSERQRSDPGALTHETAGLAPIPSWGSPKRPVTGLPDAAFPAGTFRFVAIDVETANRDAFSICQIGCAMVDDRNNVRTVSTLINPECVFSDSHIGIHGIGAKHVEGAPSFAAAFQHLLPLLRNNELIQHSSFDRQAILAACERYGIEGPELAWNDSVVIARRAWPELISNGGHGLANLKQVLNLEFNHHDAEEDARAAAMVVLLAEERTGQSFKALSDTLHYGRSYPSQVKMAGNASGPLFGQVAVFTGRLSIARSEAARLAANAGISVKPSVSKKVTLVVVGDQDLDLLAPGETKSAKHRRAEELIAEGCDIRIIGESDFKMMVEDCVS